MVRIKHRYLLVNILYPPGPGSIPSASTPATPAHAGKGKDTSSSSSSLPVCDDDHWQTQFRLQVSRPTTDALNPALLARMVRDAVDELYGDWGMGRLGGAGAGALSVKYFSPATSTAIIRCPRSSYRLVWSALTYISRLPAPKSGKTYYTRDGTMRQTPKSLPAAGGETQRDCVFRVVRVSGTMKKAEQEAIRRARMEVVKAMKSGEEKGAEILEGMFGGEVGGGIESEDDEKDDESEG